MKPALGGGTQALVARTHLHAIQIRTGQPQPEEAHIVVFRVIVGSSVGWRRQDQIEAIRRRYAQVSRIGHTNLRPGRSRRCSPFQSFQATRQLFGTAGKEVRRHAPADAPSLRLLATAHEFHQDRGQTRTQSAAHVVFLGFANERAQTVEFKRNVGKESVFLPGCPLRDLGPLALAGALGCLLGDLPRAFHQTRAPLRPQGGRADLRDDHGQRAGVAAHALRPAAMASTRTVPLPQNGSSTSWPSCEKRAIAVRAVKGCMRPA